MTVHFDTLDFVKTLTAAGIDAKHAEALARAHAKSMDDLVANELASKADLNGLRGDMVGQMAALRAEVRSQTDTLRAEMKSQTDTLRAEFKSQHDTLRAEVKSELQVLAAQLKSDFQTELRSLKYGASIAAAVLSVVVVLVRLIK